MTRPWSLQRELLITVVVLVLTLLLVPGMIYLVGGALFGAYGGGLIGMYQATLTDLWVPRLAAWGVVITPMLCVALLRVLFHFTSTTAAPEVTEVRRREPTLGR